MGDEEWEVVGWVWRALGAGRDVVTFWGRGFGTSRDVVVHNLFMRRLCSAHNLCSWARMVERVLGP